MKTNRQWQKGLSNHPETEANYDIRFFLGMDCFSDRFRRLFDSDSNVSERMLQSSLIICSLGDDDKNLEAAMMMRRLFEGIRGERTRINTDPVPDYYLRPKIFAIVFDDQRFDCVSNQDQITRVCF